jgi:serine/threonine protein kinase/tetratricopeptide (TPR) repeat protein
MTMPDEEVIFNEARRIDDPAARTAYLVEACGRDESLRSRIESLLNAHEKQASFLGSPVVGPETAELDPPILLTPAGTVIGRYKLLEPIGEGGYGVVFMAEQTSPVHRKVALKIVKAGMDTRQVIARFEAERQALALMDHPNIAKVFDAGVTETGRPYFVMELVKGVPITKYCDEHRLTPQQRLKLFVPVCHAVQHAHQKGIIHRDLKPSNVLIAQYDGVPVSKVIDFGVAKAMGQQLTERTMFTGFGDVIGTPQYMSPEQAELNQLDVDTRSDIYSLGVLLYELLTGTTPLESKRVQEAALLEVLRVIREEEPPKPSTRLTKAAELPSIAAQRGSEPRHLAKTVHGELDWIVMKALEKDRSRRYETANGLARDIERYLHDEPVLACPPSTAYRFRKFARRHKATFAMVALVIVFVLAGLILLAVNNVRLKAEQARTRAESQRAQAELVRADGNLGVALQALDETYLKEIETRGHQRRQLTPADRELVQKGLEFYRRFAEHNAGHVALREEVAKADRRLGYLWRELGKLHEAHEAFDRAIPVFESLLAQAPGEVKYRRELASCLSGLSIVLRDSGRSGEAEEPSRRALALWETVIADPSSTRDDRVHFGHALWEQGMLGSASKRYEVAERHFMRALDLFRTLSTEFPSERFYRLELGFTHLCLFQQICIPTARNDEAKAHAQEAINIYQRLAGETADNERYLRDWAYTLGALAELLNQAGEAQQAQEARRQARVVQEKVVAPFRVVVAQRPGDPWAHQALADALAWQGRPAEAEAEFREAIHLEPNNGGRHHNLADVLVNQGKHADAVAEYTLAVRLLENPVASYHNMAMACARMGRWEQAAAAFEQVAPRWPDDPWSWIRCATLGLYFDDHAKHRRACGELLRRFGDTTDPLTADKVAKACALSGDSDGNMNQITALTERALNGTGKLPERPWLEATHALVDYRAGRFVSAAEILVRVAPTGEGTHRDALAFSILAMAQQRLGKVEEARAALMNGQQIIATRMPDPKRGQTFGDDWVDWLQCQILYREAEHLLRETSPTTTTPTLEAMQRNILGSTLIAEGKLAEAVAAYGEAIRLQPDLADAWAGRGECRRQMGEFAKMIEDYSHAIELRPSKQWYWHERAYAHLMLGEHEKSIADHSKSIELGDQDPGQRVRRGHSYRALGQLQKAEEDFSRAIELSPSHWEGWYQRARLYHQQHEPEKAQADIANAATFANDPGAQNAIAWYMATDPDPTWRNAKLAVDLAERAIAARPGDGMIWNTVGAARYRNGQWKDAVLAFEKSIELRKGGDANDWFFVAMCHWQLGERDAARKSYDKAVEWTEKHQPRNPELRRFRTEAEELLKVTGKEPTTKAESTTTKAGSK